MADTSLNAKTVYLPFIGQRYYATMPADGFLTTVHYKLWAAGGGGGGGGWDSNAGGEGAGGAYVEGIFYVSPGQLIEIFVGQGGGAGTTGGGAGGGANGKSKTGFSGGRGGNSGPSGSSGSGGGGGGPTMMLVNSGIVAIAGGGGGGPGGGQSGAANASAALSLATKTYLSAADQSKGVAGNDHPGDGGGGGGGGGGNSGGEGGQHGAGDVAGQPGKSGSNSQYNINPAQVGTYSSGRTPGGYNFEDYPGNNVGVGGVATPGAVQAGGNGYAVLTFYNSSGMYVKANGQFTRVAQCIKHNNFMKAISWVKVSGQWHPINSNASVSFSNDLTNWGDAGAPYYNPPVAAVIVASNGGSSHWDPSTLSYQADPKPSGPIGSESGAAYNQPGIGSGSGSGNATNYSQVAAAQAVQGAYGGYTTGSSSD